MVREVASFELRADNLSGYMPVQAALFIKRLLLLFLAAQSSQLPSLPGIIFSAFYKMNFYEKRWSKDQYMAGSDARLYPKNSKYCR